MADPTEQFRSAMRAAGIDPPYIIEADGELHRFSTNGTDSDKAGWYVFHKFNGRKPPNASASTPRRASVQGRSGGTQPQRRASTLTCETRVLPPTVSAATVSD
jgi:hypothetical protein